MDIGRETTPALEVTSVVRRGRHRGLLHDTDSSYYLGTNNSRATAPFGGAGPQAREWKERAVVSATAASSSVRSFCDCFARY